MLKKRVKMQGEARLRPLEVTPRPHESAEKMIKRFTKKVRNEGILQEVYERRSYLKPSQKRRRKHAKAMFNKLVF